MTGGVTPLIVDFATAQDEIPETARQMMRLCLLDWCACAIAAKDEPVARILRQQAIADGGAPRASIIGSSLRLPVKSAALVNGATSHALDYDDTHFAHIGHPSAVVIPAALAIAQQTGAGGAAFLDAALVGAELSIRTGMWLGRAHYQAGFHQTATAGAFGAATAACRLLGLDKEQVAHAIGVVATRASGLKSQFGTMGKPFNAGMAAANGVEAASLAGAGFRSNPNALDAEQGFGPTHAGENRVQVFDGLGQEFLLETISHKFHACCHGLHAALEALGEIRKNVAPGDVAAVTITTHPRWLTVCNITQPTTGLQAKFSYRLSAAMVLNGLDTGALATFSRAACQHKDLLVLRDKVRVKADQNISETMAVVTVDLNNRASVRASHDLGASMDISMRETRLRAKATAIAGAKSAAALWDHINAAQGPDLSGLCAILSD